MEQWLKNPTLNPVHHENLTWQYYINMLKTTHKGKMAFRTFPSPSGALVLVGKSAADNDTLTFKLSQSDDLWFHVKGIPGSHVLLRGEKLSSLDVQYAANLAAHFSKARGAKTAQVEYCSIWDVSKPKNAKPGLVSVRNCTTVLAYPTLSS